MREFILLHKIGAATDNITIGSMLWIILYGYWERLHSSCWSGR